MADQMPDELVLDYSITSTYRRTLKVSDLPVGAPMIDDADQGVDEWLDRLADWIEEHGSDLELEVLREQEWVDTDATGVQVNELEAS